MKKSQRGKAARTTKSALPSLKSRVRKLDPRKAGEVKGGLAWTKGGGAAVG